MIQRSYKKLQLFFKDFSRTTLDFQGPPTRNTISQIVWFQKISIPLPRMVLPIRPPHPLGIFAPEGSYITPYPPGISYFPFHGVYLPHLEIIDRVPFKVNCSHLKTQFFIIFNLFVIFYKAIYISYAGRACLIMSSLSFLLVHPAKHTRHENRD